MPIIATSITKERIFPMKHLKKLFTLLLVFTITVSSFNSLEETYTYEEGTNYNEDIELLGDSPFFDGEKR